jgi:hypothetical protein
MNSEDSGMAREVAEDHGKAREVVEDHGKRVREVAEDHGSVREGVKIKFLRFRFLPWEKSTGVDPVIDYPNVRYDFDERLLFEPFLLGLNVLGVFFVLHRFFGLLLVVFV